MSIPFSQFNPLSTCLLVAVSLFSNLRLCFCLADHGFHTLTPPARTTVPLSSPCHPSLHSSTLGLCHLIPASRVWTCYSLGLDCHSLEVSQGSAQCRSHGDHPHLPMECSSSLTLCLVTFYHFLQVTHHYQKRSRKLFGGGVCSVSVSPPRAKASRGQSFPCPVHRWTFPVPEIISGRISDAFRSQTGDSDEWWGPDERQERRMCTSMSPCSMKSIQYWNQAAGQTKHIRQLKALSATISTLTRLVFKCSSQCGTCWARWCLASPKTFFPPHMQYPSWFLFLVFGFGQLCLTTGKFIQPKTQLGLFTNCLPKHNYLLSEKTTENLNQMLIRELKN